MRLITKRNEVLQRLAHSGQDGVPLLCPNAETPDEMEGIMHGAQQYALANSVTPATLNYQLRKDADDGTPVWNVTCIDQGGKALGGVVVAANKGNVLSHNGFTVEPEPEKKEKSEPSDEEPRNVRKRYVVRSRSPQPMRQQPPVAEKPNFLQRMFGGAH